MDRELSKQLCINVLQSITKIDCKKIIIDVEKLKTWHAELDNKNILKNNTILDSCMGYENFCLAVCNIID